MLRFLFKRSHFNYITRRRSDFSSQSSCIPVHSDGNIDDICHLELIVNASSCNESLFPSGITHFLKCLSFHSSLNYPSRIEFLNKISQLNASVDCKITREDIIYCITGQSKLLAELVDLLGEAVFCQLITDEDLQTARLVVADELKSISLENWVIEAIYHSAYRVNTMGLPHFCLPENVESEISREHLISFLHANFKPKYMNLYSSGVSQSQLEVAAKSFNDKRPPWCENGQLYHLVDKTLGEREESFVLPNSCLRIHPLDIEDTYVAISFSSVAPSDPFFELFLLLQNLSNLRLRNKFTSKKTWSRKFKFSRGSVLTAVMRCKPHEINESIHDLVDHWKGLTSNPITLDEAKLLSVEDWFHDSKRHIGVDLGEDLCHGAQHLFHSNPAVAIVGNTANIDTMISYSDICTALYVSQDAVVKYYDLVL